MPSIFEVKQLETKLVNLIDIANMHISEFKKPTTSMNLKFSN